MRSPSRAVAAATFLLVLAVAFALVSVAAMVSRSAIPHALDGTVAHIEVRREKHPGVDDVWLVHLDDGSRLHVDAATAQRLDEGSRVRKPAWQATLAVDGEPVRLALSDDAIGMLWVMPLTVLSAGVAAAASLRSHRGHR